MTEAYETSRQTVIAGEYETTNEMFCYCINYYFIKLQYWTLMSSFDLKWLNVLTSWINVMTLGFFCATVMLQFRCVDHYLDSIAPFTQAVFRHGREAKI